MSTQPTNLRYYPAEPWELRRADYLRRSGRPLDPKVPVVEKKRKEPIHSHLLCRYIDAFPNYAWTDAETALDLMAAEIKALRHELGNAQQTIVKTSQREAAEAAEQEKATQ